MASYYDLRNVRFRPIDVWPGAPTKTRQRAAFSAPWSGRVELLNRELRHLGAKNVILQVDIPESMLRLDGFPRADARARSPGVILALDSKFGPLRYPCDTFYDWQDNLYAIALALEALRKVDRYGVTKRGEQYTGWKALGSGQAMGGATIQTAGGIVLPPAPNMKPEEAARYLALHSEFNAAAILKNPETAAAAYRAAAKRLHPDTEEGVGEAFKVLGEAKRVLDQHHGTR